MTKADIEKYFTAEKRESFLFMLVGLASVVMAFIGWFAIETERWKGAALPLFFIGILPLIVGYTVYRRSDKQMEEVQAMLERSSAELKQKELPRIQVVNKNFVVYRWIEIVFIVAALTLINTFYNNTAMQLWSGFGIALAILATILLIADHFAERRAQEYTKLLEKL
jgi:drug/metabolite transporter (DMT)-like permease